MKKNKVIECINDCNKDTLHTHIEKDEYWCTKCGWTTYGNYFYRPK